MNKTLSLLFIILAVNLSAQCDGLRYKANIFDSVSVTSDVVYGSNTNIFEFQESLAMDIYEPFADTLDERALIIFAHGGAFILGDKADSQMVVIGTDYAKMGYVTASINYRLGFTQNPILDQPDSADAIATVVRATHDLRAAIRYFRKDVAENNNQFGIDTNLIFLAGFSAGGFMVIHHAYLDTEEEWPEFPDDVIGVDGGIEGNSGNPGYSSAFVAGLNLAGAIGDTSWIQSGDEPLMSTHGTEDQIVPYGDDTLSFTLGPIVIDIARVFGSSVIHQRLDEVGVDNCFFSWEGEGHVPESELGAYYDSTFVRSRSFFSSFICNEEFNCDYDLSVGIAEELIVELNINVFPNPFNEMLYLRGISAYQGVSVDLFDMQGRMILNSISVEGDQLDMRNIEKGAYLLVINSNERRKTVKVLKN